MFYLLFEGTPQRENPESNEVGGAVIGCWIERPTLEEALQAARSLIAEERWAVADPDEARSVCREDYEDDPEGLACFEQALTDKEVLTFHCYPKEEPGIGEEIPIFRGKIPPEGEREREGTCRKRADEQHGSQAEKGFLSTLEQLVEAIDLGVPAAAAFVLALMCFSMPFTSLGKEERWYFWFGSGVIAFALGMFMTWILTTSRKK